MITSELLRIRYTVTGRVILTILLAVATLAGLFFAFLSNLIGGLIALNKVIPNATDADQFTAEQLAALTLVSPQLQIFIADILHTAGTSTSLPVVAATLFGALTIAGEFRRGSFTNAVLSQPIRSRLVLTKATAIVAATVVAAVILIVVQGTLLAIGLVAQRKPLLISPAALVAIWGQGILALVLYALLGMGLGLLIRNQVATISVIFTAIVIESLIRPLALLIVGGANPTLHLPFALANDIIANSPLTVLTGQAPLSAGISALAAFVTLLAWVGVVLVAATIRLARADIPVLS